MVFERSSLKRFLSVDVLAGWVFGWISLVVLEMTFKSRFDG
jgi:hypothetical protein